MLKDKRYILAGAWLLFSFLSAFAIYFIFNQTPDIPTELNQDNDEQPTNFTYLPTLNHAQFEEKFNSSSEFYVYIGRPDCGDSIKFEKEFKELFVESGEVRYGLSSEEKQFYYFDISEIIDSTSNKNKRMEYLDKYGFYYTPSLVHYKDIDGDGVVEAVNIAEWDGTHMFLMTDYLKWFYDTGLIEPNQEVYHEGESDKQE